MSTGIVITECHEYLASEAYPEEGKAEEEQKAEYVPQLFSMDAVYDGNSLESS